ncbi:multicopper oxidase domain-containing protein, partial [Salmonella enterica subsp. enterica serovar Kentucky]|nr:multicopper oxidase domain-containing protein [Salmonella enterica subsp. enterica serovar Kentucky]
MTVAGLLVPGPLMGGPARMMSPNADWAPVLPIRQSAATLWYHMVASLISPDIGVILFEGQDITTLSPEAYRQQVSYCAQTPALF